MNSLLRKFIELSAREKCLVLLGVSDLILLKLILFCLPFAWFKWIYTKILRKTPPLSASPEEWAKSIQRAAAINTRIFTCLPRALAFKRRFRDSGYKLIIGVKKGGISGVEAHAWVENAGVKIIGDMPEFDYLTLWEWQ